jgi:DNA-binding transcriptional MerR regulator
MSALLSDMSLTAAECAKRTGLTVRTLRVYERYGFIKPVRNQMGWRRYNAEDLKRLNSVVTLKALGFTLSDIGKVMSGALDMEVVLKARIEAWTLISKRAENGLALARLSLIAVKTRSPLSIDQLCNLVRSMTVNDLPKDLSDFAATLHTPEEQEQIIAKKMAMVDDPLVGQAAWASLISDVKRMIAEGVDPTSKPAQAAAEKWRSLLNAFTGGNAQLESKGKAFWEHALDQDPDGANLPFGKAEWDFIGQALKAA